VGAFDESGDVGHHESPEIGEFDDSENGFKGGEWVVGDFRPCGGASRDERAFSGVRHTDESDVGDEF